MSRKKPVLPEFIEQIAQLEDMDLKVTNQGYRHDLMVRIKTHEIRLMLNKSNSGRSFQLFGAGVNSGIREWDPAKIQSIIMSLLVRGTSESRMAQLLRELRANPSAKLPKMVTEIVATIGSVYVKEMGGDDRQRRIAEAKKLFDQLKDMVTEEEVLQWYREAHVKKVMES